MKKGFTLIELLAVIVILAIIAVIATPIVLNIIDESKNNATLRSAEFYVKAAELSIAQSTLKDKNIQDGTYNLKDGDICLNTDCTDKLEVEVNGEVPTSGTITITNGNISDLSIVLNDKTIVKNSEGKLVYQDGNSSVKLCTANTTKVKALIWYENIDLSPEDASSYEEEDVGLLASDGDAFAKGVAYTCNFIDDSDENNMIFFVLSSTEDTVTLILGANLGDGVAWSADGYNHQDETEDKQAVTAKAALLERTANWLSENGGKLNNTQSATIKLPTKDQIEGAYTETMPKWLYGYTKEPVAYGYWTSTPTVEDYGLYAFSVNFDGDIGNVDTVDADVCGVRPVITISKSDIG